MNTLKAKATIKCHTCGCSMKRTKSIKVEAGTMDAAKAEAGRKVAEWTASLAGQSCRVCRSILAATV